MGCITGTTVHTYQLTNARSLNQASVKTRFFLFYRSNHLSDLVVNVWQAKRNPRLSSFFIS